MADVKWIKITTDVFDNWKIKHIKAIPEIGHSLVCVWFELLCMAGSCNENGMIIMSNRFVATDEIISEAFHEDLKLVRMALQTFEEFGMIEVTENSAIQIKNWCEYQNAEKLAIIREYERERKANSRSKQQPKLPQENVPDMSTDKSTDSSISYSLFTSISNIISYLNNKLNSNYKCNTKDTINKITARLKDGFTEDDFYQVIDYKVDQWKDDPKMKDYLRPMTLFGTKFESYLQSAPKKKDEVDFSKVKWE